MSEQNNSKVNYEQINDQSYDFKERTKNVFETLDNLESVHQNKRKNYERDDTNDDVEEDDERVSVGEIYLNEEDEENSHSNSQQKILRKHPQQPDHVVNPHKYKKYSLEDVDDNKMSGRANTQAAMNFLNNSRNVQSNQQEGNEEEEDDDEEVEEEEDEDDDDDIEEVEDEDSQTDGKIYNKQFGNKDIEEDDEDEITLDDDDEQDNTEESNDVVEIQGAVGFNKRIVSSKFLLKIHKET